MKDNDLLTVLDAISAALRHWIFDVNDEDLQNSIVGDIDGGQITVKGLAGARLLEIESTSKMLYQRLGIPPGTLKSVARNEPREISWGSPETKEQ